MWKPLSHVLECCGCSLQVAWPVASGWEFLKLQPNAFQARAGLGDAWPAIEGPGLLLTDPPFFLFRGKSQLWPFPSLSRGRSQDRVRREQSSRSKQSF